MHIIADIEGWQVIKRDGRLQIRLQSYYRKKDLDSLISRCRKQATLLHSYIIPLLDYNYDELVFN
jgi:hypothetical protein